jgi:hypothetical protein
MLKKILIILASLIIGFLIYVVAQPSSLIAKSSISIKSNPQEIYLHINNHLKWEEWSPWANLDDRAEKFFGGPLQGVDSYYKWSGNDAVGAGTSTIIENKENEYVKLRIDYTKPTKTTAISELQITKLSNNQVRVDWNIYGEKNFIAKLFGIFINCQEITEIQMEKGLNNLKNLLESRR